MSTDESTILELAGKDVDYYALLSSDLDPTSTEKDITSAYRRTALKHHPDKNPDDPDAAARFHELTLAYQVLTNAPAKAKHDATRAAREARKAQSAKYDVRRKELIDELERGEARGRAAGGEKDEAEMKLRRMAEDGRRRRQELTEKRRRDAMAVFDRVEAEARKDEMTARAVTVRWDPTILDLDEAGLQRRLARFGPVDGITMRGERKVKMEGEKRRRTLITALVVFESLNAAREAVDVVTMGGTEWRGLYVEWAEGKEPEQVKQEPKSERLSAAEMRAFLDFEASTMERMRKAQDMKMNTAAATV
jgi:DnaJ homolog subfamily C member 17